MAKILQIFNQYIDRGGEEVAVENIGKFLCTRHTVRTLLLRSQGWQQESWWRKWSQPLRMFWNPSSIAKLSNALDDAPDFVLLHNIFPVGSLGILQVLHQRKIPFAIFIHNFRPFSVNGYCWARGRLAAEGIEQNFWPEIFAASWRESRFLTAWLALVLWVGHGFNLWNRVPGWIAISDFTAGKFSDAGILPSKLHLLPHCWPGPVEVAGQSLTGPVRFLFLGRLTTEKGVLALIDAWRVFSAGNSDAILTIAGNGPLLQSLAYMAADIPSVLVVGHVDGAAKAALLKSCHALVVPSIWWEPFGLVVLEAFSYSKPVIAFESGALPELVEDGVTGWLVPPQDQVALVSVFEWICRNPEECRRRGTEANRVLLEKYGVEHWLDGMEEIMAKVKLGMNGLDRVLSPVADPS